MCLKTRVFRMCVEPSFIYGSEVWCLSKAERKRLIVTQRSMMRKMIEVTRMDKRTNEWLHRMVPVQDIRVRAMYRKWNWARRVANLNDDRWAYRILNLTPLNSLRKRGRPRLRWRDEIVKAIGNNWDSICRRHPYMWKNSIYQQAAHLTLDK